MTKEKADKIIANNGGYVEWTTKYGTNLMRLMHWKDRGAGIVWLYCKTEGDFWEANIADVKDFWSGDPLWGTKPPAQ